VSFGPCQFPTLGFVAERYYENKAFVSESFWRIDVKLVSPEDQSTTTFKWKRARLFDRALCFAIYGLLHQNPTATVLTASKRANSKQRPLPLTTVVLQKIGSAKLHMSSADIMKAAEDLYTKGYISYPRTETDQYPEGTDFPALLQLQTGIQLGELTPTGIA
jgi:DNA topoisomerase-3